MKCLQTTGRLYFVKLAQKSLIKLEFFLSGAIMRSSTPGQRLMTVLKFCQCQPNFWRFLASCLEQGDDRPNFAKSF